MCSISTSPDHSSSYSSYSSYPSKRPTGVASPSFPRVALRDPLPGRPFSSMSSEESSPAGWTTKQSRHGHAFDHLQHVIFGTKKNSHSWIPRDWWRCSLYLFLLGIWGWWPPMVLSKKSMGSSKLFFRQIRVEAFHFYRHFTVLQQGKNGTTFKREGATKPAADGCLHSVNWAICKASWNTCKYIEYIRKYMYMCACEKVYIYIYLNISKTVDTSR